MGFRAIERTQGVHHTTVISWVKQIGEKLPDAPPIEEIPEVGELLMYRLDLMKMRCF
jgi:transposase-like protein